MKTTRRILSVHCLVAALCVFRAGADEIPLVRGEDRVDVPAIREGLSPHNLFQSNMVLQRDKPVPVWGWAAPGETVSVSFSGQTQTAVAGEDRLWKVTLSAMPANAEPRQMIIRGQDLVLTLENILVGDIWILGGQSNMEFPLAKLEDAALEIESATFEHIRLLKIPLLHGPDENPSFPLQYQWSDWSKRHFRQGYWDVCSPETAGEFSGIGYIFGRRLYLATRIPIGLIDVSRGGATLETFTPHGVLNRIDTPEVKAMREDWDTRIREYNPQKDLEDRIAKHREWVARMTSENQPIPPDRTVPDDLRPGPANDMNRPGACYAGMMAPIAGMSAKGVLWHQGFNNALQPNGHAAYAQIFPEMIASWRKAFQDPQLPFGIISLCTAGEPQDLDNYLESMLDEGVYIRAVQYQTFLDFEKAGDKNIGYASSFDQRRSWFHPQIKIPVGERIAKWALATQYGKRLRWKPPTYSEMSIEDGKIHLRMAERTGPYHDGPMLGFAIAGADGKFQPARAEWLETGRDARNRIQYDRTRLILSSPLVPDPVHFRYAWSRNPLANLKAADQSDIPFATQRSDRGTLDDLYEAYAGRTISGAVISRGERNQLSAALRAEDLRRRRYEAEQLLREPE